MPERGRQVPPLANEQDQSGISRSMHVESALAAAHHHDPLVSLAGYTSRSEAPRRERHTVVPSSPIRKTGSRVSPRECREGRCTLLHRRLQQGHDARGYRRRDSSFRRQSHPPN
jgi:hypothetical protein